MRRFIIHLTAGFALCAVMIPGLLSQEIAGANQWVRAANMQVARADACSVALADGSVLVAGGSTPAGALNVVELYRTDGTFIMAASLLERRAGAACVGLPDSRVLVAGGSDGVSPLASAEIFDPERNTWTTAGNMSMARTGHQATLTPWGSVVITGGDTDSGLAGRVEIYQPDARQFRAAGTLSSPRKNYALAILPDRRVLIAGGTDGRSTLATIEVYDAATGAITPAGSMLAARRSFSASTLLDGRVLIAGGLDADGKTLASTEIFDPSRSSSVAGSPLSAPRAGHTSYTLPHNANVLLVGGANDQGILASTEMFLPWGERYPQTPLMNVERSGEAAALLRAGGLMVAGGINRSGYLASSELYRFATIETDKPAYSAGDAVAIAGAGWNPGEFVSVQAVALSVGGQTVEFSGQARADEAGRIALGGFKAPPQRSGRRVLLTASGTQSLAQTPVNLLGASTATITVTVTPNPSALQQPLSVTVTATGGAGTPTGTVKLVVDNTSYGSFLSLTSGSVTFPIPDPSAVGMGAPAATHTVGVDYSGDSNYQSQAAIANQVNQVVQQMPWVASAVPSSGSGSAQTFTLTVADSAGAGNISYAYFLVNSSLSAAGGCFVEFNHVPNTFRLQNDAGSGWLGPITLGTAASLSNSQCTITGNGASSIGAGNNLAITIPTTFAFAFGGAKSVFGYAYDSAFTGSGWITTGSWTAPGSGGAAVLSALPSSGSGSAQTFTLTVADGAGAANISYAYFLVNSSLSVAGGCFVEFNHVPNTFRLQNDAGSGWLGPITLGSTASLSNSQCTISGNGASSIATGNNLAITIPTTFAFAFGGAKSVFGYAYDSTFNGSGWITTGSWSVPSSGPPVVLSALPASGSASSQTFILTVADGAGAGNISYAYFLVNSSLSAAGGCFVEFNHVPNTFRLQNDAGSGWLGPITLGSTASLSNSQCTITGNGASSIGAGNNLAITIPTTFAFAFGGAKSVFGYAYDSAITGSGWITTGSWTVSASGAPAVLSALPATGSGSTQTFTLTVADGAGAGNISLAYFLVNSSLSAAGGCFVEFNHVPNTFRLQNDAGSGWLGPITLGSTASLSNSQCTITGNGASSIATGNNLAITIPTTFAFAFGGAKNVFGYAYDSAFNGTGWITTGSWNVPSSGPPTVVSILPASGSGFSQTFSLTVADGAGTANISLAYFLVNSSLSASSACYVEVNRAANTFRLQNDAGTGWLGPTPIGTGTALVNNQCTVSAATASTSSSGNNLTVNIPVTFTGGFAGLKSVFGDAYDNAFNGSGWVTTGSWNP